MKKLKEKWKVSWLQFTLIICTFAIGGSICGRTGKMLLDYLNFKQGILYWILYVIIVTILWPIAVLLVSVVFGQFSFFKNYIKKMGKRILGK